MHIQPLQDKLIVRPIAEMKETTSGIVIPDTIEKEKPQKGEVLAVGPGKRSEKGDIVPMDIAVSDTILFRRYAPTEINIEGEELYILSQDDVLGIIK